MFLFCRLTCHFILQISDQNSLTGTMPTEIGMMTSLREIHICKLSSFAFRVGFARVGSSWSAHQSFSGWLVVLTSFLFHRLTCHFILQISGSNSLTGTIPTEIGMMTSLVLFDICKFSSFAFRWRRPCWVFLGRIPILFKLVVGCAHNISVLSPYLSPYSSNYSSKLLFPNDSHRDWNADLDAVFLRL
jgi:hypothetical protein